MGYKHNDRCLERADEDEPIFCLRAQDVTAPSLIQEWIGDNLLTLSDEHLLEARECVRAMDAWQKDHPSRVKRPD